MNEEKHWYAVYTKPRWEKKVADLLTKKNIENYCPLNKVKKEWSDRLKTVYEPLISSYVFVNISIGERIYTKETDGILNFVYWLGKPAVIRNEEIDIIRKFLNEYINVAAEKIDLHTHDKIRVMGGPFMMEEGKIVEIKNRTVKVILPSLGYRLTAEIEKKNIEKLS